MQKYEIRVAKMLNCKIVPRVTKKDLLVYRKFLSKHLDPGTILIGREDFLWEEFYLFGPGDKSEYEFLKQSNPSYKDEFILLKILYKTSKKDIVALVKRIYDGKKFKIGLSWLTTKNKKCKEFEILDNFASWVVNC